MHFILTNSLYEQVWNNAASFTLKISRSEYFQYNNSEMTSYHYQGTNLASSYQDYQVQYTKSKFMYWPMLED